MKTALALPAKNRIRAMGRGITRALLNGASQTARPIALGVSDLQHSLDNYSGRRTQ